MIDCLDNDTGELIAIISSKELMILDPDSLSAEFEYTYTSQWYFYNRDTYYPSAPTVDSLKKFLLLKELKQEVEK